jgi:hypothetical protein
MIWAISCSSVQISLWKYIVVSSSLHLFFKNANHLLCFPVNMLSFCGEDVPFYAFLPCPFEYIPEIPGWQLLGCSSKLDVPFYAFLPCPFEYIPEIPGWQLLRCSSQLFFPV